MAFSIDKEALIEILGKYKDPLSVFVLVIVLCAGGWFLYQESAQSVDEIMQRVLTPDQETGGPQEENTLTSNQVVDNLLVKREKQLYDSSRNPFGSPEDQMKMRKEVESAYQRGVELFESEKFEEAIEQFDRVISLDMTESRYDYPVMPSEYKRRARREHLKQNFDRVVSQAESDIEEGDRLAQQDELRDAADKYSQANDDLNACIDADPEGEVIGEENLEQLKTLQQEAFNKMMDIRGKVLLEDIEKVVQEAQEALDGSNYIKMLRQIFEIRRVQNEVQTVDPNQQLVSASQRNRLNSLADQLRQKISDNFPSMVAQADQQFTQAISENDLQKANEAISAMRLAVNFDEDNEDLPKKINDYIARRADLLIEIVEEFISEQETILEEEKYDEFDEQRKRQLMQELAQHRDPSLGLNSQLRNKIVELESKLKSLRLPPPVTDAYSVESIQESSAGRYKIEVRDKSGRSTSRKHTMYLQEGSTHTSTKITLKQVDTDNGFVILSKPGYMDAEISLDTGS